MHEHDFLVPWAVTHKMDAGVITEIYTNEVMDNALKLILAWRSKCLISFLVVKLCLKGVLWFKGLKEQTVRGKIYGIVNHMATCGLTLVTS